jgi:hypothetical protein
MATLKEIYDELDRIWDDINEYADNTENSNLFSDITKDVADPLEHILSALDTIIDDKSAGIYDLDGESDFLEGDEESW